MGTDLEQTVVADPPWLPWVLFPPAGAGLGWLITAIADWVARLAWAPLRGPFRLVASIAEPYATLGALVLGALGGLVFAALAAADAFAVTVTGERAVLRRGARVQRVDRDAVSAVFLDGRALVLLGPDTGELARETSDQPAARVRAAFLAHGYPWCADGDPHRDSFSRWVEDAPGLPDGAAALFRARAKALDKKDRADADELRAELAGLGIVVRDEKNRQYWRPVGA